MRFKNFFQKKIWFSMPFLYTVTIFLGVTSGYSDIHLLKTTALFITDIFIKIFKCISLPIIALSIIVTLSNYSADVAMRTIWRRTICYTISTTIVAASLSALLYLLINPSMVGVIKHSVTAPKLSELGYFQHIANLMPSTIFAPFLEHQVLSVVLISIVIGIAIRFIPEPESREIITKFFGGMHGLFMVITNWIVAIIPLGLFGFIISTVIQLRGGMVITGIGEYLLVIVLANLVQGLVVLPLWLKSQGINPFATFNGMLPALSIAFFSKSSVGTLPVTMKTAEKNLDVKPEISRFVLPFCTSLNMNGCAAFIFTTVIYLMQNHGIEISYGMMALWVVIATIAAIGNAGVPMGCFFLSASLLASIDVPITLMGVILPFYALIDMLETALNVWSDSCIVKMIDYKMKQQEEVVGDLI